MTPAKPSPRGPSRTPWLFASALYALLAVVVSWPLSARLGTHLPLGRVQAATVAWFNLWTLEWNADRLAHGYAGYFAAPIFAPARSALLFSEPQGATGLLFAPLSWLLGSPAAYGVVLLLALCANGLAMRCCVRVAGGSDLAATCAGALAVALPYTLQEIGVLQLTMLAPPLLVLAEVLGMLVAPSPRRLPRAAAWLALTLWTCEYYALLLELLLLPAGVLVLLDARARAALTPRASALALLLVLTTCAPLVLAQREALHGRVRSAETIRKGSLSAISYVRPAPSSVAAWLVPALEPTGKQRSAYPGLVLLGCAALGVREGLRGERRRVARIVAAGGLLAVLVAFGTRLELGPLRPYALTIQHLPGFAELRSPYRMLAFVQLALVVLASFGFDALSKRVHARTPKAPSPRVMCGALVALALLETVPLAQRMQLHPEQALREPWIRFLSQQPRGHLAVLPGPASGGVEDFEPLALSMLQGLRHGQPLVTGYSGFFPPFSDFVQRRLASFPEPRAIDALRLADVRYVVVDDAWVKARVAATGRAVPLPVLFSSAGRTVYAAPR